MDVFLLMLFAALVAYGFIRLVAHVIPKDREARHERMKRRDRKKLDDVWDDLVTRLKKDS